MMIIFMAAAVVISFFVRWDDMAKGFHEGWNDAAHASKK